MLKDVLPRDHGAWAFLLIPGLALLGAHPSTPVLAVSTLFLWVFLLRGVLACAVRTPVAWALGVLFAGNLVVLHLRAVGPWWEALLPAAVLGPALWLWERKGSAKRLAPQLLAAVFASLQVPAGLLALGGTRRMAWLAFIAALLPWLPTLAFLRLRVAQARPDGRDERRREREAAFLVALAGLAGLALVKLQGHLLAWGAWMVILGVRALVIVHPAFPRPGNAIRVGLSEIAWSLATAAVLAWTLARYSWRAG